MNVQPIVFYKKASSVSETLKPKSLVVYLKTTETCQLNCKHCFTNGVNGKKIYFDPRKTVDWFNRLHEDFQSFEGGSIIFHGGEPFLAPLEDLYYVWENTKDLWKNVRWSCSTNLTYNLTDAHIEFFDTVLREGFCTSWDRNIRFENDKQQALWLKNVKTLVNRGHNITLNISLNKDLINMNQYELVEWLDSLGVKHVQFERLTHGGNAVINDEIFPTNAELDSWIYSMHKVYTAVKPKYNDVLLNNIYSAVNEGTHNGVRCRDCEQKIFTINADGTVSGCPNSAVGNSFGHIEQPIVDLLTSPKRINNIRCELERDNRCYSCDVFEICNSDCHQLEWQGDVCAAPKTLMRRLKDNK